MHFEPLTRRELVEVAGAAAMLGFAGRAGAAPAPANPEEEFIRVAPDRWTFETAVSHRRFVRFGANLVLTSKDDLDIFEPRYGSARYDRILEACARQKINL